LATVTQFSREYAFNHLNVPNSLLQGSRNEMVLVRATQGTCKRAEGVASSETLAMQGERLWRIERDIRPLRWGLATRHRPNPARAVASQPRGAPRGWHPPLHAVVNFTFEVAILPPHFLF
jgi:hypothetical protein